MTILELVFEGSEVLQIAFEVQRRRLREQHEVVTVDLLRAPFQERRRVLQALARMTYPPQAVLVRGMSHVEDVMKMLTRSPVFVDHCAPYTFGAGNSFRAVLSAVKRVYVYGMDADTQVRRAGNGRITQVPGPYLPTERTSKTWHRPVVGVLNSCSQSPKVLDFAISTARAKKWDIEFLSPIKHPTVRRVESNVEAVENCDVVLASQEDPDGGQPHDSAILALACSKPLITSRTHALTLMGFPAKRLITVPKYLIGSYALEIGTYLSNRVLYDTEVVVPRDPFVLPNDLLQRIG